jgi:hypothetical protein
MALGLIHNRRRLHLAQAFAYAPAHIQPKKQEIHG